MTPLPSNKSSWLGLLPNDIGRETGTTLNADHKLSVLSTNKIENLHDKNLRNFQIIHKN